MSCFIVSDKHINTLLTYASLNNAVIRTTQKLFSCSDVEDLQEMADILLKENIRSVDACYSGHECYDEVTESDEIIFTFERQYCQPMQIFKLCICYDYQAGETDNYKETTAAQIIQYIQNDASCKLPGFEDAEWTID